jgi:hypothetical protein
MEFERVGSIAVCDLGIEIGGEVNDGDGFKRTPEPWCQGKFTKMSELLTF